MDERVRRLAEQLLDTGFDKLSERECRVITGVAKRSQVSRDVNSAFDEVNLKAELEIMGLHEKLDRIRSEHLEGLLRAQEEQLGLLTQLVGANGPRREAGADR